jgi:hypothetical protein
VQLPLPAIAKSLRQRNTKLTICIAKKQESSDIWRVETTKRRGFDDKKHKKTQKHVCYLQDWDKTNTVRV